MINHTFSRLAVIVVGMMIGLGPRHLSAQTVNAPTGMETSMDMVESTVLKVFSAEEDGLRFVAYLVKWKDAEVIVSDPLARSNLQVGDQIEFMVHKVAVQKTGHDLSVLSFIIVPSPVIKKGAAHPRQPSLSAEDRTRFSKICQGDLNAAHNEEERFYGLNRAAKIALAAGKTEEARQLATELMRLLPQYRDNWNYGNAVQDANQVLGRIALQEGDVAEAKKYLLASAESKGSPQLNSFGPNIAVGESPVGKRREGRRAGILQTLRSVLENGQGSACHLDGTGARATKCPVLVQISTTSCRC